MKMTMQSINMFLLFWTVVEGNFIIDQQFINLAAGQRTYCVERVVGKQSVITSAGCSFRWVIDHVSPFRSHTVSTERKYTLAAESMGCATPTIELVQNRPGLILKFEIQNEAWPSLDQLNGWFGVTPTFHLAPLSFEYSAQLSSGNIWKFGIPRRKTFTVKIGPKLAPQRDSYCHFFVFTLCTTQQ